LYPSHPKSVYGMFLSVNGEPGVLNREFLQVTLKECLNNKLIFSILLTFPPLFFQELASP
jgi:ribosomal protein S27E